MWLHHTLLFLMFSLQSNFFFIMYASQQLCRTRFLTKVFFSFTSYSCGLICEADEIFILVLENLKTISHWHVTSFCFKKGFFGCSAANYWQYEGNIDRPVKKLSVPQVHYCVRTLSSRFWNASQFKKYSI